MEIKLRLLRNNETRTVDSKKDDTVEQVIKKIGLHPDSLIVLHQKKPVPLDESVGSFQELTLVEVTSGG